MSARTERPTAREALLAAAVLTAAELVLFFRVIFLDAALHGRDVLHHYWPLHEAVRRALADGRLPAWDPTVQGGMPLLANPHAAVFYPFNLLYQLLEFPRAYAILIVFHALVLGLGTWALWRRWVGQPAALAGALALMLGGPVASLNAYGPLLSSLSWVPWAVLVQLLPWSWPRRVAALAVLLALQVLGGDPMPALFTGLLSVAALALFRRERGAAGVLSAGFALGGLLSAMQALPSLELLSQSVRGGGGSPQSWSLHPARLLELVAPDLFGHYLEAPGFWGNFLSDGPVRIPFLLSAYFGAAACGVVVLGVRRSRFVALGLLLLGLGLLLALGPNLVAGPLLSRPPFSFFRYPEKYLLLAAFGFSGLVAAGLDQLNQPPRSRFWALAVAGLAALGLLLSGPLKSTLWSWLEPTLTRPGFRAPLEWVVDSVREASVTALGFSLLVVLLVPSRSLPASRAGWLMVATIAIDLLLSAQRTVWTGPVALYRERPELVDALPPLAAQTPFRIFRDNARLEQRVQRFGTYEAMADRRAFDVLSLKSALGTIWGLDDVGASSAVVLARWNAYIRGQAARQVQALELYNVCAAISVTQSPLATSSGVRQVAALPFDAAVFALQGCAPRVRFVEDPRPVSDADEALRLLAASGFDPRTQAAIEHPASPSGRGARVLDSRFAPSGSVELEVEAPQGGVLLYSATWFPGWRALVDGRPAEVFPANVTLIGVEVPPGARAVRIQFAPNRLALGVGLAALGALITLTLWVLRRGRESSARW